MLSFRAQARNLLAHAKRSLRLRLLKGFPIPDRVLNPVRDIGRKRKWQQLVRVLKRSPFRGGLAGVVFRLSKNNFYRENARVSKN
ncbi:MAG: hypothetical protein H6537_01055 [Bacteroidales bacterium]|nr:hypothetical protein [Bacteroidales bacterium]